ncbi:hypothetical protein R1CP_19115 [Rhodococcus opacus]|uniref:Uncharacterized protein n=1 Tax=Rhodococcus opacus TaxID=37919 RepID=A0A1B1K7B8_RHOOP|nr:hypothetical protein [Rhodococcus opacus]ANS28507.1 hypothetical protein R1CP_19115 [Rhodococcus opacus]
MPNPEVTNRLAALDAVLWAINNRHELDDLAFASANAAELIAELQRLHGFTDEQCNFIVTSSARVLTQQYRDQITAEREEVLKDLND